MGISHLVGGEQLFSVALLGFFGFNFLLFLSFLFEFLFNY